MTSRERVIAAINHQTPDRCPIDLGSCGTTGMNISTVYRLRKALGLDVHRLKAQEVFMMLGEIEEDLLQAVHGDVVGLWGPGDMGFTQHNWKPFDLDDGTPTWVSSDFEYDIDKDGNKKVYTCGDRNAKYSMCMPKNGLFFDILDHSEQEYDMDIDDEDMTPEEDWKEDFCVCTDEDARFWEEKSKKLYEETEYAIMGLLGGASFGDAAMLPGPTVKNPKGIRKADDWYMAHILHPDYIAAVLEMQTEVLMKNLEIYKQAVGDRIQVISVSASDYGTQKGLFINKELFQKLYKPHYKKINDWIHKNTNWKTFYHSCGCINDLLDDFVEMGVDCLNPIQFSAMEPQGMTPQLLKEKYGDKLTFWGGGVDTQRTLPFGTPEDVIAEVTERVRILNQNGGYVFNPIHNVVGNIPAENLIAMYEAVWGGPLKL